MTKTFFAEVLHYIALKPAFLAEDDSNLMNIKELLLKGFWHYNGGETAQILPKSIDNFTNKENSEKVLKLRKARQVRREN